MTTEPTTPTEMVERTRRRWATDPTFKARVEEVLAVLHDTDRERVDADRDSITGAVAVALEMQRHAVDAELTARAVARGVFLPPDHQEALDLVGRLRASLERMGSVTPVSRSNMAEVHRRSLDALVGTIVNHAEATWHQAQMGDNVAPKRLTDTELAVALGVSEGGALPDASVHD